MPKRKVLFVCVHNSARSQMAEAFLKDIAGDRFQVESAGLEPGELNSDVVKSMQEVGIDISNNTTDSVFEFFKKGKLYNYVITVCEEQAAERCPIFPGPSLKRIHWSFKDPAAVQGNESERLQKIAEIRDSIKTKITEFVEKD